MAGYKPKLYTAEYNGEILNMSVTKWATLLNKHKTTVRHAMSEEGCNGGDIQKAIDRLLYGKRKKHPPRAKKQTNNLMATTPDRLRMPKEWRMFCFG